jgi:cytidine deaminase
MQDFIFFNEAALVGEDRSLVELARQATHLSYAPYSSFFVGAALLLADGSIVLGANQENVSYPLCMCAERVALYAKAVQHPAKEIMKMAVVARKAEALVPATCCGACRQVMLEFEQRQAHSYEVIMMVEGEKWLKCRSAAVLIPFQFQF